MNPEISSTDRFVDRLSRAKALDPTADAIATLVNQALAPQGPLAPLNDLLHGKPLGHSLHAAIVSVPLGAWTMALVFDALELAGRKEFVPAADLSVGAGLVGALGAIATGLAEWADTKDEPKRLGLAHALSNDAAFLLYSLSLGLRRGGKRPAGIATALAGYAAVSLGAYLGGEISLGYLIGTKHTATPIEPSNDFIAVLAEADLGDEPKTADLQGIPLLLSRDAQGGIHAISAVCTHRGAPLGDGTFSDGCVTCPWHGSRFDLTTGGVLQGPATFPLARFETRIVAGQIEARRAF